jgi:hypothetical protein
MATRATTTTATRAAARNIEEIIISRGNKHPNRAKQT